MIVKVLIPRPPEEVGSEQAEGSQNRLIGNLHCVAEELAVVRVSGEEVVRPDAVVVNVQVADPMEEILHQQSVGLHCQRACRVRKAQFPQGSEKEFADVFPTIILHHSCKRQRHTILDAAHGGGGIANIDHAGRGQSSAERGGHRIYMTHCGTKVQIMQQDVQILLNRCPLEEVWHQNKSLVRIKLLQLDRQMPFHLVNPDCTCRRSSQGGRGGC